MVNGKSMCSKSINALVKISCIALERLMKCDFFKNLSKLKV